MDKPSLSRRQAIQRVTGIAALATAAEPLLPAQANPTHHTTREDFVQLMKQLSNWNRWGKGDQMGAVNLITPAKRKPALALVKEGASYSMARDAEMEPAVDNSPIVRQSDPPRRRCAHHRKRRDGGTFFISYHGYVHTHMDSLCHFLWNGEMYNGYSRDEVTDKGAAKNAILNFKNGIISRGVLMDMARHTGVEYLEPGNRNLSRRPGRMGEEGESKGAGG
jgi:hypothetical protein